jgi:hypothetical protein
VDRLVRLAGLLGDERRKATGSPLPALDGLAGVSVDSKSEFDQLVSRLYVWLYDECGPDIAFLMGSVVSGVAEVASLREFRADLNALRQWGQHREDTSVMRDVDRWFKAADGVSIPATPESWEQCASVLVKHGEAALGVAIALARSAVADPLVSVQWSRTVQARSLDLPSTVSSILVAIGRRPPPAQSAYLERQAEREWSFQSRFLNDGDDHHERLEATAAMVVVGWTIEPLPCSPIALLGALGIAAGDTRAASALVVAHAFAEASEATGDVFIAHVVRIWAVLQGEF